MKKNFSKDSASTRRWPVRYMLPALLGLIFSVGLGVYHRSVRGGESYHQFYSFPEDQARPVVLKYGEGGFLHRLISRHTFGGTLGLTNTGGPVKIRMKMIGVPEDLTIHWGTSYTRGFNIRTKTVERVLNRGDSVSVHHTYHIGRRLRKNKVILNGGVEIVDDVTGDVLLTIPVRILNADLVQHDEAGGVGFAF